MPGERRGDIERREAERKRARRGFEPGDIFRRRVVADHVQPLQQRGGAAKVVRQPLALGAGALQNFGQPPEAGLELGERRVEHLVSVQLAPRAAAGLDAEGEPQIRRRLFHALRRRGQLGHAAFFLQLVGDRVAGQAGELMAGKRQAEKVRRHVGELMRLVKNDRLDARQQLAEAVLLQGEVGEKQMVVDYEHVRGQRRAPRAVHKTVLVARASAAEAVVGGRGHARPYIGILRDLGHLGEIAGAGASGPAFDLLEIHDLAI